MVVLGAFIAYCIADGWAYSVGIIYVALNDYFQDSKGKTAVIGALLYGVPLLISPVICAFTNVYGCRIVAFTGSILMGFAFILSMFANSVEYLCVTLGVVNSLGLAMIYVPSIVAVTYYFEKHRGLATGLATAGSGIGAFVFPPLIEQLLKLYKWKGTMLLMAGICLHLLVAAALFRPIEMFTKKDDPEKEETVALKAGVESRPCAESATNGVHRRSGQSWPSLTQLGNSPQGGSAGDPNATETPLLTADDPDTSSAGEGAKDHSQQALRNCPGLAEQSNPYQDCTVPVVSKHESNLQTFKEETLQILRAMLDRDLFRHVFFLLFCGSNFVLFLFNGVPYVYLPDKAIQHGISEARASFLLAISGITRLLGQIALGLLGDHAKVDSVALYGLSVTVVGIATLFVPLSVTYPALCVYAAVFGFFISVTYCLPMVALVELVGMDKVTSAFGIMQLGQGIGTLLGTPIGGKY